MNSSIEGFYTKNMEEGYGDDYDKQHGSRLDAFLKWSGLDKAENLRIGDFGGGRGFLGKRLHASNKYGIVDGAHVVDSRLLDCPFFKTDLDHEPFGELLKQTSLDQLDAACLLETIEHLTNPYHCLVEIKKLVKKDAPIYISYPHENVWHNTIYPGLFWPTQNFEQFLGQMALPIEDKWLWERGWNAYHFRCRNADWTEARMMYEKSEPKFRGKTPQEYTNL